MSDIPFTDKIDQLAHPFRETAMISEDAALFVGRLQPLHFGHLHVISELSRMFSEVIIAIGSAEKSFTRENPFTAGERHIMVRDACRDEGIKNFTIVTIEDTPNNVQWLANLKQFAPPFKYVYGNNAGVLIHFQGSGYETHRPDYFQRDQLVGTRIRQIILQEGLDAIKPYVPDATMRTLVRIGAEQRLRGLNGLEG